MPAGSEKSCKLVFVLRFLSNVWWTRICSNTIAACVNVLFIQLRKNMIGLARKSFVLLIFLTNGGIAIARIQNISSSPSNTKLSEQSGPAGPLPWELTFTPVLSVETLLKYITIAETDSAPHAAGVTQFDGPRR